MHQNSSSKNATGRKQKSETSSTRHEKFEDMATKNLSSPLTALPETKEKKGQKIKSSNKEPVSLHTVPLKNIVKKVSTISPNLKTSVQLEDTKKIMKGQCAKNSGYNNNKKSEMTNINKENNNKLSSNSSSSSSSSSNSSSSSICNNNSSNNEIIKKPSGKKSVKKSQIKTNELQNKMSTGSKINNKKTEKKLMDRKTPINEVVITYNCVPNSILKRRKCGKVLSTDLNTKAASILHNPTCETRKDTKLSSGDLGTDLKPKFKTADSILLTDVTLKPDINANTSATQNVKNNTSTSILRECSKVKPPDPAESVPPEIKLKLALSTDKAVTEKKIFGIGCSNYSMVIKAFVDRGWVQKFGTEDNIKLGDAKIPENLYVQRLLQNVPLNFLWVISLNDWTNIRASTVVNKFPRSSNNYSFTTKIGLNLNLQQAYWYHQSGVANVKYPPTFSIMTKEDLDSFIDDYIMTACTSLLKIVVSAVIEGNDYLFNGGEIPIEVVDFAILKCKDYVKMKEHRDIDSNDEPFIDEQSKNDFLHCFYQIAHENSAFKSSSYLHTQGVYLAAKSALEEMQHYRPEMKIDGCKNLWLLKKSNLNCGKGVVVLKTLQSIIESIGEIIQPRFVVQKYIERPLLIHNTKFDIRQWFLVTCVNPLQIWMYSSCYLRFSTQVFTLNDISESVHLCNNSIQRNYSNNCERHQDLPEENMWDSKTFRAYLDSIGEGDKWDKIIFPGMKECIIATIMATQEDMVERSTSFELYGADFMLTDDYKPWLIEVNASPAMGPSTSVTARLCAECLNDLIKVIFQWPNNPNIDTGGFFLIHNQELFCIEKELDVEEWTLEGVKMRIHSKNDKKEINENRNKLIDLENFTTVKTVCLMKSPDHKMEINESSSNHKMKINETCVKSPLDHKMEINKSCVKSPLDHKMEINKSCVKSPSDHKMGVNESCMKSTLDHKIEINESCKKSPSDHEMEINKSCVESPSDHKMEINESCMKSPSDQNIKVNDSCVQERSTVLIWRDMIFRNVLSLLSFMRII